MSIKRRLSPEASRSAALDAARDLLIEQGPQGVTLKAVAGRVGRTHANLLHHFGSAAELQKALADYMSVSICTEIARAVIAQRDGNGSARDLVNLTFDAFEVQGGAQLVSWMRLVGNVDALDTIVNAIHAIVDEVHGAGGMMARRITQTLVLLALGDSLIGKPLAQSLKMPRSGARDMALRLIEQDAEQARADRVITQLG
jgi:AcrR family transcriptional regulator